MIPDMKAAYRLHRLMQHKAIIYYSNIYIIFNNMNQNGMKYYFLGIGHAVGIATAPDLFKWPKNTLYFGLAI